MSRVRWLELCVIVAAGLLSMIPLAVVVYPPLQDLPNHLARIVVLGSSAEHPIHDYYAADWRILPNLVTDIILLGLSKVMSLAAASKVLLFTCSLGWVAAPMLLHRAVYGRFSVVPMIGALLLYNNVYEMGFLNFFFGSVAAVLCLSGWVAMERSSFVVRLLAGAAMALFLFFCHLFVACVFVLAVVVWEAFAPVPLAQRLRNLTLVLLSMLPTVAAFALSPIAARGPDQPLPEVPAWSGIYEFVVRKITLFGTFLSVGGVWDIIVYALLAVLIAISLWSPGPRLSRRLGIICSLLLVLFIALPSRLFGGANVDWRMLAPLALLFSAWPVIDFGRRTALIYAAAFVVLFGIQTAGETSVWLGGARLYADYERATAKLPPGARLVSLAVAMPNGSVPSAGLSVLHYGSYAVIERNAVVPSLFAFEGQQPIVVRSRFQSRDRKLARVSVTSFERVDWQAVHRGFDYVLTMTRLPAPDRDDLDQIGNAGIFTLYKVRPRNAG